MPFKIMLTCNNGNSIIKDLRHYNVHPDIFRNLTYFAEEQRALQKNGRGLKGLNINKIGIWKQHFKLIKDIREK